MYPLCLELVVFSSRNKFLNPHLVRFYCILTPEAEVGYFCSECSRDEVKTRWSVSDFIKAFIKFHGHVYLSKSLEKLSPLREKLEEQFKVSSNNMLISILRRVFLAAKF